MSDTAKLVISIGGVLVFWGLANFVYAKKSRWTQVWRQLILLSCQLMLFSMFAAGGQLLQVMAERGLDVAWLEGMPLPAILLFMSVWYYSVLNYSWICGEQLCGRHNRAGWDTIPGNSFHVQELYRNCYRNWACVGVAFLWAGSQMYVKVLILRELERFA
jgi:hypothetical protein